MKNKKLLFKISIIVVSILIFSILILSLLGKKERIGYLSDFNLNIDNTLKINGLDINKTKQLFTIGDKLNENAINNFIFTNTSITNYNYDFRIKYYSKVFRNSDIYGVYLNIEKSINDNDYIKEIEMGEGGNPFGNLTSIIEINNNIENIYYYLNIKYYFFITIFCLLLLLILIFLYKKKIIQNNKKIISYIILFTILFVFNSVFLNIYFNFICIIIYISYLFYKEFFIYLKKSNIEEYRYLLFIFFVLFIVLFFQFILVYPGYFQFGDIVSSMTDGLYFYNANWHPRIISLSLGILYRTIGYHSAYILIINYILLFISLFLIISSLYIKYKNKYVLLLLLLSFLSNIFFMNINHTKDSTATGYVIASYSLIFSIALLKINKKSVLILFYSTSIIFIIIGMLWRHNFIVTVYPIFVFFSLEILRSCKFKYFSIKKYIASFLFLMAFFALMLLFIYITFPKITNSRDDSKYNAMGIYIGHIVVCAVGSNDDSMIPKEWYRDGKSFEDIKLVYLNNKLFFDPLWNDWGIGNTPFSIPLNEYYLSNIKKVWIQYILKYPYYLIKHIFDFSSAIYTSDAYLKININELQKEYNQDWSKYLYDLLDVKKITLNELETKIYNFLHNNLPFIEPIYFIIISIFIFIISFILLIKCSFNNSLLIFAFSSSFSSISTAIIVGFFSPAIIYRYIYPLIPISILSLIGFITFMYDIGGFKKFIKELKGHK